jgi:hypothetical protein
MSKKFYVIIPFSGIETPAGKVGFSSAFKGLLSPSKFAQNITDEQFQTYRIQLDQRVELVRSGISSLGLESKIVETEDLKKLFIEYYNPGHEMQFKSQE